MKIVCSKTRKCMVLDRLCSFLSSLTSPVTKVCGQAKSRACINLKSHLRWLCLLKQHVQESRNQTLLQCCAVTHCYGMHWEWHFGCKTSLISEVAASHKTKTKAFGQWFIRYILITKFSSIRRRKFLSLNHKRWSETSSTNYCFLQYCQW